MSFDLDGLSFVDKPRADECELINLTTDFLVKWQLIILHFSAFLMLRIQ